MNTLQEYADVFERLGLTELQAEDGERKLVLRKEPCAGRNAASAKSEGTAVTGPSEGAGVAARPAEAETGNAPRQGDIIKAPLLGIFHATGNGRTVSVGDHVSRGEAVCTIEAMKMMNEVTAPRDGVIAEILADEGALVEYHQDIIVLS